MTTGSWKGRGNQYIEFARVVYCKLPTNGKQLPAFPLTAMTGIEPRPQRWEARVLPLCHRGPLFPVVTTPTNEITTQDITIPTNPLQEVTTPTLEPTTPTHEITTTTQDFITLTNPVQEVTTPTGEFCTTTQDITTTFTDFTNTSSEHRIDQQICIHKYLRLCSGIMMDVLRLREVTLIS